MKRILGLVFMVCSACAPLSRPQPPAAVPEDCVSAFVMLPSDYIIDLAADARVELNPAFHSFLLFCSAKEAQDAFLQENAGATPVPDWRAYRLDQPFAEIASPCGYGQWCLGKPAIVEEWIP